MTDRGGVIYTVQMQHLRSLGLSSLLALSLLSACAAADPLGSGPAAAQLGRYAPSGVFGDFLAARFAASQSDPNTATDDFLKALAVSPSDPDLLQQAFLASVMSGRSEAVQLAHQLPDNPVAQLLLADQDARSGNWAAAEKRFQALPQQGLTQLLRPLLVAWSQAGAGQTDAALATLRPFVAGQRFRGIFALHAAMIADLGDNQEDASRFYAIAQAEMPQMNLRLTQILASWDARTGHPAAAQRTIAALADGSPDMTIAAPALEAASAERPVTRATDGMAETYLALGGALRAQDSHEYAMLMLRLALDLRPGLTAARLLAADLLSTDQHPEAALQMLASIPASDALGPVIRMRRVGILVQMGRDRRSHAGTGPPRRRLSRQPAAADPARRHPALEGALPRGDRRLYQRHRQDWPRRAPRTGRCSTIAASPMSKTTSGARPRRISAMRCNWRRISLMCLNYLGYSWADKGEHLAEARADDPEGGGAPPERRRDHRQPGLGDAAPGRYRRRGAVAGACGRVGARGSDDQRPSGRRVFGGRAHAGGAVSVAPGANPEPGAGRHGEIGGQATNSARRIGRKRPYRRLRCRD